MNSVSSSGDKRTTAESSSTQYDDEPLPFIHRFITNWLITDPSLIEKYRHHDPSKPKKNYQVQKHSDMKYIYLFGGRWRSVKQKPINLGTGFLIVVPAVLFWIFEAGWIWHHISKASVVLFTYFWALSAILFVRCTISDAGVLPRNLHVPTTVKDSQVTTAPDEYFNTIALPYYKSDLNGVTVKYCGTCHIWRPPRTYHCAVCNTCCTNHDHHCVFLNNCVGFHNYKYFLWFLLTVVISAAFLIILSFMQLLHYKTSPGPDSGTSIHSAARKHPMSLFLAIYGCLGILYPLMLLVFHLFITGCNISTREYLNYVRNTNGRATARKVKITETHDGFINVFDTHSVLNNLFINWVGKPRGATLVKFKDAFDENDVRFERINPLKSFTA